MLISLLKELQKRHHNRKIVKKNKKLIKNQTKDMSFNRDINFRYMSSSPHSKNYSQALRNEKDSQNKLYRSKSELVLNESQKSESSISNDNLSDAESRFSHDRTRNDPLLQSQRSSSLQEGESEDGHEVLQKRIKNKKKTKKHKRAIVIPAFSQVVPTQSTSVWDGNNNSMMDLSLSIKEEKDKVPDNWMPIFLPSYKSRLTKFHRAFEEIPPNEKLVDDYVCALRKDILLQGRLYISVNYIAFHSNILGYETILTIKFSDVTKIVKSTTLKVFPNAIEIYTTTGEKHILTSFVSRERAFALMLKLWQSSGDNKDISEKITWPEICKYIRNSYITNTLPHDLNELDHLDLEQHILKGKTITKKLQTKKEKIKLLEYERSHLRCDSNASFLSACEDFTDDETTLKQPIENKQIVLDKLTHENNKISIVLGDTIQQLLPGVIGEGIANAFRYCADEKHMLRICVIFSLILLIVQMGLFFWVSLFEDKINDYEKLLIDKLAARRMHIQPHSILTDSV